MIILRNKGFTDNQQKPINNAVKGTVAGGALGTVASRFIKNPTLKIAAPLAIMGTGLAAGVALDNKKDGQK